MNATNCIETLGLKRIAGILNSRASDLVEDGEAYGHKAFMSDVFARCGSLLGLDSFEAFCQAAWECHKARLLVMSRADMVEVMDPAKVAASTWKFQNATFNFING